MMKRYLAILFACLTVASCASPSSETTATSLPPPDPDYWTTERMRSAEPVPMSEPKPWWERLFDYLSGLFNDAAPPRTP
ncbi:MAG: hypothetical protein Q4A92_03280 [Corynebacterium sp.]|nr:hypothetical protein [Corynebacterium sp.]